MQVDKVHIYYNQTIWGAGATEANDTQKWGKITKKQKQNQSKQRLRTTDLLHISHSYLVLDYPKYGHLS